MAALKVRSALKVELWQNFPALKLMDKTYHFVESRNYGIVIMRNQDAFWHAAIDAFWDQVASDVAQAVQEPAWDAAQTAQAETLRMEAIHRHPTSLANFLVFPGQIRGERVEAWLSQLTPVESMDLLMYMRGGYRGAGSESAHAQVIQRVYRKITKN